MEYHTRLLLEDIEKYATNYGIPLDKFGGDFDKLLEDLEKYDGVNLKLKGDIKIDEIV